MKRTDEGELRAFLPLGGRSVLAWQFDLAIKLGCERIVCLCAAPQPEILKLQHEAERIGCEFHAVKSPIKLVSLFTADQELFVIADGLLVETDIAEDLLSTRQTVVTIPSSSSLVTEHPQDFERIDADRAWAGLARMRGNLVARLADLPGDGDVISLLLRLALQAGVSSVEIGATAVSEERVLLAENAESLRERQRALFDESGESTPLSGPFLALASFLARQLAPTGLQNGALAANIVGFGLLAGGVLLSWTGYLVGALVAAAIGAFGLAIASAWKRFSSRLYRKTENLTKTQIFNALRDILVVTVLAIPAISLPQMVLPVFAVGLIIVAARQDEGGFGAMWADRSLHLFFWVACTALGQFIPGIAALGLLALGYILLRNGKI